MSACSVCVHVCIHCGAENTIAFRGNIVFSAPQCVTRERIWNVVFVAVDGINPGGGGSDLELR